MRDHEALNKCNVNNVKCNSTTSLDVSHSVANNSSEVPITFVHNRKYRVRYRKNKFCTSPHMEVKIGGISINAFVHTGATLSTITPKLINLISKNCIHRRSELKKRSFYVTLAIGSEAYEVKEEIELQIEVNGKPLLWKFFTIPQATNDLVVGMDFLQEFKAILRNDEVIFERNLNNE